jgi:uncharacterized membrane protein YkvA (DUF1232 family)
MTKGRSPDAIYGPDGRRVDGFRVFGREAALVVPNLAKLLGRLATDERVPTGSKRLASAVAAYLVSPIDLIPEFVPRLGSADDILIALYALNHLVRSVGEPVIREHWDGSDESLDVVLNIVAMAAALVPRPVRNALAGLTRLPLFGRRRERG